MTIKADVKRPSQTTESDSHISTEELLVPDHLHDDVIANLDPALEEVQNRKQSSIERILLASFWTFSFERRDFFLFPELMVADCTAQTNDEGRPMFIISGRDAEGKLFVALRAFLPSECRWVFQYIWSFVVPKLFGDAIKRNQVLLTDGDANIYEPFCQLRESLYPNSNHYLCFYHLVAKQLSIITADPQHRTTTQEVKKKFYHILLKWMTTEEYLTQEEFVPAQKKCEEWLESLLVHPETQGIAQALKDFLIKSIYPRLEKILFMFRKGRLLLHSIFMTASTMRMYYFY